MGIYDVLVKRILCLCKEKNITPNGLSYISGVPQATIKSILNGESKNPGIVTIKKICDGFDISIVIRHKCITATDFSPIGYARKKFKLVYARFLPRRRRDYEIPVLSRKRRGRVSARRRAQDVRAV